MKRKLKFVTATVESCHIIRDAVIVNYVTKIHQFEDIKIKAIFCSTVNGR